MRFHTGDPRRRMLVVLLAVTPHNSLDIATAAHLLAVPKDGSETTQITNVRTSLKRSHADPLATAGIVDYENSRFQCGPRFGAAIRAIGHAAEKPVNR